MDMDWEAEWDDLSNNESRVLFNVLPLSLRLMTAVMGGREGPGPNHTKNAC